MKLRQTKSGRATSMVHGLTIGTAACLAITLIATILIAKLIDQEILSWEKVGYSVIVTVLTASFCGALISYKKIKHQRLAVCLLTGVAYWAVLIGTGSLLYKANYQGVFVTSAIILDGSICAFLVSGTPRRRSPSGKYRIPHR